MGFKERLNQINVNYLGKVNGEMELGVVFQLYQGFKKLKR